MEEQCRKKRVRKLFECICKICNAKFLNRNCEQDSCCVEHVKLLKQQFSKDVIEKQCHCGKTFFLKWHTRFQRTCCKICRHTAQAKVVKKLMIENNPMKNSDVSLRVSKTRSKRFKEDSEFSKKVSEYTRKTWAEGKYDGVKTGKCKWYDHKTLSGKIVKLQGTWEVAFARRLDELRVDYIAHVGRWDYFDSKNVKRSYYVDFYIPMWDAFIDVKGVFWIMNS